MNRMRLIDADKINFEEAFGGQSDFAKEIRESAKSLIDRQPTTFDKEKVIEQIKVLSAGIILNTNIRDCYAEGYVRAAKDIIEIIEKGGIERRE